jgi:hypothetical protein
MKTIQRGTLLWSCGHKMHVHFEWISGREGKENVFKEKVTATG